MTLYFPPAGGGGVQRPLKLAQHLPALGIETHVLAPDDPKWIHVDPELRVPTQAWVHRARYVGPKGRKPAEELHGTTGLVRAATKARLASRRLLVPDENVSWNLTAIPAAIRIARAEKIDAVITTSPPASVHFVGAAVQKATGARWLADLRDSIVAHPHRRAESLAVRAKEKVDGAVARLVASRADAISCVSEAIAEETRRLGPRGQVATIANGCDFDDFAGLEYRPGPRFRITHTGSFFGKRDPRPFLQALADSKLDVVARFVGDFRSRRPRVGGDARPRRPARADPVRAARPLARAPARLGGAAAPDPRRGRPRQGRPLRKGLRVSRRRPADPRRRPTRRRRRRPDPRVRRGRGRAARRPRRAARGAGRAARAASPAAACRDLELDPDLKERLSRQAARRGDGRAAPVDRAMSRGGRATDALLLATLLTVSFAKLQWNVAGALSLSDVLTLVFLLAFAWSRWEHGDGRLARAAAIALLFFAAFLLVYLVGFFNLDTEQALAQWAKGMVKFLLHFLFLVTALAYLARRGERLYWLALAAFCGGLFLNAGYGVLQLGVAETTGFNLDQAWLQPLTGGASAINVYGAVSGQDVYRPNGLTGDPNHLGIDLAVALLILTPIYLRLERGHRLADPARGGARVPAPRRAGDAVAERPARPELRRRRARAAVPARSYARPRSGSRSAPSPC